MTAILELTAHPEMILIDPTKLGSEYVTVYIRQWSSMDTGARSKPWGYLFDDASDRSQPAAGVVPRELCHEAIPLSLIRLES
jgi:hypothetical protein